MVVSKKIKRYFLGYMFILPNLIGFAIFIALPVLFSLILAFCEWNMFSGLQGLKFIGLDNFYEMANDKIFIKSFFNNIFFTAVTVPVIVILSLLLAVLMNRQFFAKGLFRGMFFFPYVSNFVSICIVWMALFHRQSGPINSFIKQIGISDPPGWLGSTDWALAAIMIITIWVNVGYIMIIYLAALQNVPKSVYEAADIDGANHIQKFFKITVPSISPTTFFVLIITLINSFKVFAPVNILTQGGPGDSTYVLVYYIFISAFRHYRMGYGSAMAWALFAIIFTFTYIQWKEQKKWVNYM